MVIPVAIDGYSLPIWKWFPPGSKAIHEWNEAHFRKSPSMVTLPPFGGIASLLDSGAYCATYLRLIFIATPEKSYHGTL